MSFLCSSLNAKSSAIPLQWQPNMDRWLKKMGYRLALRRLRYPATIVRGTKMHFETWWENMGVAPCYKKYVLAFRLKNEFCSRVITADANIRHWLPGDNLYDSSLDVPSDMPAGRYTIQAGLVDSVNLEPRVKLAIQGLQLDGWYDIGSIDII